MHMGQFSNTQNCHLYWLGMVGNIYFKLLTLIFSFLIFYHKHVKGLELITYLHEIPIIPVK
jgi:hypothetical protein